MAVIKKPTDGPTDSKKDRHHYWGFNFMTAILIGHVLHQTT